MVNVEAEPRNFRRCWRKTAGVGAWAAEYWTDLIAGLLPETPHGRPFGIIAHGFDWQLPDDIGGVLVFPATGPVDFEDYLPLRRPVLVFGARTEAPYGSSIEVMPPPLNMQGLPQLRRSAQAVRGEVFRANFQGESAQVPVIAYVLDEDDPYAIDRLFDMLRSVSRLGARGDAPIRLLILTTGKAPVEVVGAARQLGNGVAMVLENVTGDDLPRTLGAADIWFALGQPNPLLLLYAQALGVAIIGDSAAAPFMQNGLSGRLAKDGDVASGEEHLRFFIRHPDFLASAQKGAAEFASDVFNVDVHRQGLVSALSQMAEDG